jgi:hypothetical protein
MDDFAGVAGDLADWTVGCSTPCAVVDLGAFGSNSLKGTFSQECVMSVAVHVYHEMPATVLREQDS